MSAAVIEELRNRSLRLEQLLPLSNLIDVSCDQGKESSKLTDDTISILYNHMICNTQKLLNNRRYIEGDNSVYVGFPGIRYALLRIVLRQMCSTPLKGKNLLSLEFMKVADQFVRYEEIRTGEVSLLCGKSGEVLVNALHCVLSIWYQSSNSTIEKLKLQEFEELKQRYLNAFKGSDYTSADEWLYGRAGYLYGLMALCKMSKVMSLYNQYKDINTLSPVDNLWHTANQVAHHIIEVGRNHSIENLKNVLMYKWHGKYYLGAAHGLVGILYMLITFFFDPENPYASSFTYCSDWIKESCYYLMNQQKLNGGYLPTGHNGSNCLMHFCHGNVGIIFLFVKCFTVFNDCLFLKAAIDAGETVWTYGILLKGGSLCHGVYGNAYALMCLYKVTEKTLWLKRAASFTMIRQQSLFIEKSRKPDHPYSLFEGLAGEIAYLGDMIYCPKKTSFPLFELDDLDCLINFAENKVFEKKRK